MADVQESYPTPTVGTGVPFQIAISGAGVTQVSGNVFKATLALGGTSQVQVALTAAPQDAAGNGCNAGVVSWQSYGISPTSFALADPNGVTESYPTGAKVAGGCTVNSAGLVTATLQGMYLIEARVLTGALAGSLDSSSNTKSSFVYGHLLLQVNA